jgi:aspartyl protease family protein
MSRAMTYGDTFPLELRKTARAAGVVGYNRGVYEFQDGSYAYDLAKRQPAPKPSGPVPVKVRPAETRTAADARIAILHNTRGYFTTAALVDGRAVDFLVDTGAQLVALRATEAARMGYHPRAEDYHLRLGTANGVGRAARIDLKSIDVGEITARDIPAIVVPDDALHDNLLGMSFLSRVRFHHVDGQLVLEQISSPLTLAEARRRLDQLKRR